MFIFEKFEIYNRRKNVLVNFYNKKVKGDKMDNKKRGKATNFLN